jgi:pimeloyl-ACP methyl ester carboxylesterase
MQGRRPSTTGLVLLLLLVLLHVLLPLAYGEEGRPIAPPPTRATVPVEAGERIRSDDREIAGLDTLVVRPVRSGPWPLVVFVHGAGAPPELYRPFLEPIAAAGHVVVAPAMPGSYDHADFSALLSLPFQPGRVRQLVTAVTTGPDAIGAADADEIVLMGHSLGAMTALATAFNTCCDDGRFDGVVALAGRMAEYPGGTFRTGAAPLLLVHGDADEVVPYGSSLESLLTLGTSAYLLTVEGGNHSSYLDPGSDSFPAVMDATLAFLTATLGDDPRGGLADLTTAGGEPGVRLTERD